MRVTAHVDRVHFDLMRRLPVRTVQTRRQFDDAPAETNSTRSAGRPRAEDLLELNRKITRLRASGYTIEEIQAMTGAAPSTIWRHVHGTISTLAKAKTKEGSEHGTSRRINRQQQEGGRAQGCSEDARSHGRDEAAGRTAAA